MTARAEGMCTLRVAWCSHVKERPVLRDTAMHALRALCLRNPRSPYSPCRRLPYARAEQCTRQARIVQQRPKLTRS